MTHERVYKQVYVNKNKKAFWFVVVFGSELLEIMKKDKYGIEGDRSGRVGYKYGPVDEICRWIVRHRMDGGGVD